MKTFKDEAFEDIERRQGGFQAKRAMAADKLQEPKAFNFLTMTDKELIETASKQVQALRMALDMIECEKYERRHVRWAIVDALKEAALAQPAQEPTSGDYALGYAEGFNDACKKPAQEPVAMRMPKVGDKVICLEDESLGTIVSLTAGGSPDIKFDDGSHGTYLLREFAELFCYASIPQSEWVGLTNEDWIMRITVDRRIEVNEGVEVTEAASKVLEAMQGMLKPPQRKPLTDEEIKHIYICTTGWSISDSDPMLVDFAQAIEAAHGIKE